MDVITTPGATHFTLVAGDPELENFRIRSKNGIPVSRELAQEIKLVAEEADVEYLLKN